MSVVIFSQDIEPAASQSNRVLTPITIIMAAIGTALMGALGHSEQEKMFRPWWDSLEDFVIYALIMLGLIVSPTTIFNGIKYQHREIKNKTTRKCFISK